MSEKKQKIIGLPVQIFSGGDEMSDIRRYDIDWALQMDYIADGGDWCMAKDVDELEAENAKLRAENERLKWKVANVRTDLKLKYEAELAKWRVIGSEVKTWSLAYPMICVPESEMEAARAALQAAGLTPDRIETYFMRYVVGQLILHVGDIPLTEPEESNGDS